MAGSKRLDQSHVLDLYREGVDAVADVTAGFTDAQWAAPTGADWSATDLAGHLVCVAGWYHEWLDRAVDGVAVCEFAASDLPARNAEALAELDIDGGPARVARFTADARLYADRLAADGVWDLPYGYPYGRATAGLHAGAATAEWHLHAWDLARAAGSTHTPSDPAGVYEALGWSLSTARLGLLPPRVAARVARPMVRRATRRARDPWMALLQRTGRSV